MPTRTLPGGHYELGLGLLTVAGLGLLLVQSAASRTLLEPYLLPNIVLAWVPFILAVWLRGTLRRKVWSSWEGLAVSAAWLAFLPNSFYMVSDFIHLAEVDTNQLLTSAVVFTSFIVTALLLGYSSLYLVHIELRRRLTPRATVTIIALILFACSVAIYLGRDLRWNTWDVLVDPAGMLFDLSSRLLHPTQYKQVFAVVAPFFVLLGSLYVCAWQGVRTLGHANKSDLL